MSEVVITGSQITVTIGTSGGGGVTEAQLATKVDKVAGKGLSTEDYTTAEKNKLSTVEENAKDDQTGAEIKTAYENEADTNAFNDADKAKVDNLPADISKYISASLGAFDPTAIVFDQKGTYSNHVLSGNTTFAKTGDLREGIEQYVRITTDSAYVLNFTSDFEVGAKYGIADGGTLTTGAWWFYMTVINGKIHVSVPGVSPIDVTAPTLSNFAVATATPFRVGFSSSEAITGTTFAGFTIPGHTITGVTINAGQTTGHHFTVAERFVEGEAARTITYDGTDGWKDVDNNELASFGPVAITNSVTAPAISSVVVAADNFTVTVNLSVGGYANDNGTGDLLVADFTPSISGGVATSPVLSNPVHTAGGTAVVFDLAYTGEASGAETLTITVASGASVFDQYGNAMQAGESGADGLNVDTPASIILMEDDFAGTTIDTGKWTVTDPADNVTISQNNQLIFTTDGSLTVAWNLNQLTSIYQITGDAAVSLDFVSVSGGVNKEYGIGIISDAGQTLVLLRARDNGDGSTPDITCFIRDSAGTVLVNNVASAVDANGKTWRLSIEAGTIKVSYWNGSSWTDVQSVAAATDSDLRMIIRGGDNVLDSAGTIVFDNAYIASETYATRYPA